jgi:hypothetical protein
MAVDVRSYGVLSNRIWIAPQWNRALGADLFEVFYRCGSQAGKVATHLPADSAEEALTSATVEFVVAQVSEFRRLRRAKGKNPSRNLKKYFDRDDIQLIEDNLDAVTDAEIAGMLV